MIMKYKTLILFIGFIILLVVQFGLFRIYINQLPTLIEPVQFEIEKPINLSDDEILKRAEEINDRELQHQESKRKYEESKNRWLKENPPVEFLFDAERRYDNDYVISYLEQFSIGGDCVLVWNQDVICWGFGDALKFPTKRP